MTEGENKRAVYVMIPRKVVIAVLTVAAVLFIGVIASFQYSNWIDRRSNQRWCDQLGLFNQAYVLQPPKTILQQKIAAGMLELTREFGCKNK